jgi:hypothetical protein
MRYRDINSYAGFVNMPNGFNTRPPFKVGIVAGATDFGLGTFRIVLKVA